MGLAIPEKYYFPHTHAAVLAGRGFYVFICDGNKEPRGNLAPHAYLSATNDLDTINKWDVPFDSTVGIACKQSRLLVIDCDVKSGLDGVTAFHDFGSQRGIDLSQCPCVVTPSGGLHYYFLLPDGFTHGNGTGSLPKGIDVRCAGYVIAPDTIMPDGREYRLIRGSLDSIPLLPMQLQMALKEGKQTSKNLPSSANLVSTKVETQAAIEFTSRERAYAAKALEDESHILAATGKGERNNQLFKSAAALFNCVASGWLEHHVVEAAMWNACTVNGLITDKGSSKFYKTLQSAISHGISTPRRPLEDSDNIRRDGTDIIPSAKIHWHGEMTPEAFAKELVKGMLPQTGVVFIAGQSGAGKTFIALWLGVCAALGLPFFGNKIREPVGTLLLLGEGAGTIAERLKAMVQSEALKSLALQPQQLPIAWRSFDAPFTEGTEIKAVTQAIEEVKSIMLAKYGIRLGLIMIDTMAAAFVLDDENDAGKATKIMQFMLRLAAETNTLVVPVAHYGKNFETGLRGSSAYTASSDVILAIHADRTAVGEVKSRYMSVVKSRRYGTGWKCDFTLESVPVGLDEDGDPIWSCYVSPSIAGTGAVQNTSSQKRPTPTLSILLRVFDQLIGSHGQRIIPPNYTTEVLALRREILRTEFNTYYPAEGDTEEKRADNRRKQFKRAIDTAIRDNALLFQSINGEDWLWKAA
jgi:KaiC/GvpD/RAD55 family RecA-like ATPase